MESQDEMASPSEMLMHGICFADADAFSMSISDQPISAFPPHHLPIIILNEIASNFILKWLMEDGAAVGNPLSSSAHIILLDHPSDGEWCGMVLISKGNANRMMAKPSLWYHYFIMKSRWHQGDIIMLSCFQHEIMMESWWNKVEEVLISSRFHLEIMMIPSWNIMISSWYHHHPMMISSSFDDEGKVIGWWFHHPIIIISWW